LNKLRVHPDFVAPFFRPLPREDEDFAADSRNNGASVLMNVKADEFVAAFGVAGESEAASGGPDRTRTTVQSPRKSRTFYFNPLSADGFDRVIDPVVLEPVVQFTLYLKLRYELETRR